MTHVIRIGPNQYIHVLDNNSNVTRLLEGPQTYTRKEHERMRAGPLEKITLPPNYYTVISNPVVRDAESGEVVHDDVGMAVLRFGDQEVRTASDFPEPFVLYPGEEIALAPGKLPTVAPNTALRLRATRPIKAHGKERAPGEEWLFYGPATYNPSVAVEVVGPVKGEIVEHGTALHLRALRNHTDSRSGCDRKAGEEWLEQKLGLYILGVDEELVEKTRTHVLTEKKALHLRAETTFTDVYDVERKAGSEWLVTIDMAETHLINVHEVLVKEVEITVLSNRQFCIVLDPYVDGVQRIGSQILRQGETKFFLQPGESLLDGIEDVYVLAEDQALLLRSDQKFDDTTPAPLLFPPGSLRPAPVKGSSSKRRIAGETWMIYGPCEYTPPVEVTVVETRTAIPLDENEGIYVRNHTTGHVRLVVGETYMLKPTEELWNKSLPQDVEYLLEKQRLGQAFITPGDTKQEMKKFQPSRNKCDAITFRVPHNAAVQVFNYKERDSRVVFGPDLVMLKPQESFTKLSLSGDRPKREHCIETLCLMLGPDFMTDVIIVETSDHARLSLQVAYNWYFDVNPESGTPDQHKKIFSVLDFTGDVCKTLGARIRAAVAAEKFDNFHKHSARIIRGSIFGVGKNGKIGDRFEFKENNLIVTNVDVQAVEPVDPRTRVSLQRSVQLAIEITTRSQEARAKHEALRAEEKAKGKLEQQQLQNQTAAEQTRRGLLELEAASKTVEAEGAAVAQAKAQSERSLIEAKSKIASAEAKAEAKRIFASAKLTQFKMQREAEISHKRKMMEVEVAKAKKIADIEVAKFKTTVEALGRETIAAMARAGPEMQAKMLSGLGLKGFLVTDGKNPINLLNAAQGMVSNPVS